MSAQNSKKTVGRPWKKGQSGNPGGRPKGLGELLDTIIKAKDWQRLFEVQKAVACCDGEMCAQMGLDIPTTKEVTEAAKFLTDRRYGKAPQSMELSSPEDRPIRVTFGGRYRAE